MCERTQLMPVSRSRLRLNSCASARSMPDLGDAPAARFRMVWNAGVLSVRSSSMSRSRYLSRLSTKPALSASATDA